MVILAVIKQATIPCIMGQRPVEPFLQGSALAEMAAMAVAVVVVVAAEEVMVVVEATEEEVVSRVSQHLNSAD